MNPALKTLYKAMLSEDKEIIQAKNKIEVVVKYTQSYLDEPYFMTYKFYIGDEAVKRNVIGYNIVCCQHIPQNSACICTLHV